MPQALIICPADESLFKMTHMFLQQQEPNSYAPRMYSKEEVFHQLRPHKKSSMPQPMDMKSLRMSTGCHGKKVNRNRSDRRALNILHS